MKILHILLVFVILLFLCSGLQAQDEPSNAAIEKKLETSGQWFLAFQQKETDGQVASNAFVLKRGYITFSKELSKNLSVRFTQDIITDEEGDDAGNIEMRLKYCYLKYVPFNTGVLKKSFLEAGMVHRPFLDFDERINSYRFQGTMFLERYKIINSADFGITYVALLGGELENPSSRGITSGYPGKYGSLAFGVYNGGGYHALELNRGKTVEGRLTLRPFTAFAPGLQVTYAYAGGKGNTASAPRFENHCALISFESRFARTAVQYTKGFGNMAGTLVTTEGKSMKVEGISAFAEVFAIPAKVSCFFRYDRFEILTSQDKKQRLIGGLAWSFYKKNRILLDADILNNTHTTDRVYELVVELIF